MILSICHYVYMSTLSRLKIVMICTASEILKKQSSNSLKSQPFERLHWPEMSQIKAEISLRINVKLIFHKNVGWHPDFYDIRF